jgi:anti-sigma regulatory factor (Ser/Thr protein kinase)
MRRSRRTPEPAKALACLERAGAEAGAIELRLPATRAELGTARERAHEAATAFGLDPAGCYEFVFAINEAVTNAIRHGAPDEDGLITIRFSSEGDRLTCAVQDEGTFTTPVQPVHHRAEHGRGLALMAKLVDDLQLAVKPGSTIVRLSKDRSRATRRGSLVADHADAVA